MAKVQLTFNSLLYEQGTHMHTSGHGNELDIDKTAAVDSKHNKSHVVNGDKLHRESWCGPCKFCCSFALILLVPAAVLICDTARDPHRPDRFPPTVPPLTPAPHLSPPPSPSPVSLPAPSPPLTQPTSPSSNNSIYQLADGSALVDGQTVEVEPGVPGIPSPSPSSPSSG